MVTIPGRLARVSATLGLLAGVLAALPSLDWCPLTEWTAIACEARAEAAPTCAADFACAVATSDHAREASCGDAPRGCATPLCDPEPDPLPMGDRLWCIQAPVTAVGAKAESLAAPGPTFALLVSPPALTPPTVVAVAQATSLPRPPLLRGAHSPPQPRAPPAA
jgi:hypothetical protein